MLLFVQVVSASVFVAPVFAAPPPNIISYQGRLLNSNRAPVSDASASILFELYTAVSGGTCVWSNSSATCASATARTVTLTDGLFSEDLGDTAHATPYAAISDSVFGNNSALHLQITINGETLTPRKQITAAPYAINAQLLDGLNPDSDGATSAAIVALNASGNLVVAGNPSGSDVDDGSLYINPAALDVAANDILLGVALGGASRFVVDAEGDVTIAGDFSTATGVFVTAASQVNLFDSSSSGTNIDIGGVDTDAANTINIATNSISADTVTLGNGNPSTRVIVNAGSSWSVDTDGNALFAGNLTAYGNLIMGNASGTDTFSFTSLLTDSTVFSLSTNALTTGTGFALTRSNAVATDFDGVLFDLQQNRASLGSDGTVFRLTSMGGGNSTGLHIIQHQVANATTSPTSQALVIDVNESASNDEVIIIRSDADGTPDTEFRFENDGDFFGDGATYNTGADYAEFFPSTDKTLGDYEVVCWNALQENGVKRCGVGETDVVGVISTNPGFVGNNLVGAAGNLEDNANYALVGLVGQIDTLVTAQAGAIRVGDPLTASAFRAGYAEKALGGTYIIGRALEGLASGTGMIKVLVQPMWYGGDMLTMDGEAVAVSGDLALVGGKATASRAAVDSAGLSFVGSSWNGSSAEDVSLSLRHALSPLGVSQLTLQNNDGNDVVTFGSTGDLAIAGNFYPSDGGALQYGAYVHYDRVGAGYMRTNASGWMSNSTGFAENFASAQSLEVGEVVEFAAQGPGVMRSLGEAYSNRIAGVVASQAGFVAGGNSGSYPVVVSGRASVRVTSENGAIAPGDALTTSSQPGFVMKATEAGAVVGYALEPWSSGQGSLSMFVRPQFAQGNASGASSSLAIGSQDIESLNVFGVLSMNGGDMVSVGTLSGIGGVWEITESGDIITSGQFTQIVDSLQNTQVSTYASMSTQTTVQLSGTTTLYGGVARVQFVDIDPNFNDIISPEHTYRVLVTPNGVTGQLYVTDRNNAGFVIRDAGNGEGVSVDWLVLAYRYDLVPGETDTTDNEQIETDGEEVSENPLPDVNSSEGFEGNPDSGVPSEESGGGVMPEEEAPVVEEGTALPEEVASPEVSIENAP